MQLAIDAKPVSEVPVRLGAGDLLRALPLRFPSKEYALLPQVRNCTGFGGSIRTADALAVSLWPSRGIHLSGIEIKVSRGDWNRERAMPEKAEELAQYCDFWWIVAPKGVVPVSDLPPTWGLLEFDGQKWRAPKTAKKLKPKPLGREFLASVMRKVAEVSVPISEIEATVAEKVKAVKERIADDAKWLRTEHEVLKKRITVFEEASGVNLSRFWDLGDVGAAVRQVMYGEHTKIEARLKLLRESAESILKEIDQHVPQARKETADDQPL